jgi:hypothetical protein
MTKASTPARMPDRGAAGTGDDEPPVDTPGVGRALALTDAVVAIAMTLLIVPLVEVSDEVDTRELGRPVDDHWDLIMPS